MSKEELLGTLDSSPANSPGEGGGRLLCEWLLHPEILQLPQITIPYVAVEGRVTLLSGREKIGKSTLGAGVVSAASRGDDVLGVPMMRPVCSLWYALDEPVSDAVRRFERLGADGERVVINDEPRTMEELLEALKRDLAKFPETDLAVIDNLSRALAMSRIDPNSSKDVEPVLAELVDFFHRESVSAILLYHTGKGGREYRGSTAIGATVDEVLTLRKRGQGEEDDFDDDAADDGRRLLIQEGRTLRGRAHLTCVEGVYRLFEDANPPRTRILETLRDHGSIVGRAELTKLAGVRKAAGLRAIAELIIEGAIIENGRNLTAREPTLGADTVPGSVRFPAVGTTTEPTAEPELALGSRSRRVGVSEVGTDPPLPPWPTRVENGKRQVLRLTQHGNRWFDEAGS